MKKKRKKQIKVEDLPVSILADIADALGCRVRFDLVPVEAFKSADAVDPVVSRSTKRPRA